MEEIKPIILHSINEECYDELRKDLNTGCYCALIKFGADGSFKHKMGRFCSESEEPLCQKIEHPEDIVFIPYLSCGSEDWILLRDIIGTEDEYYWTGEREFMAIVEYGTEHFLTKCKKDAENEISFRFRLDSWTDAQTPADDEKYAITPKDVCEFLLNVFGIAPVTEGELANQEKVGLTRDSLISLIGRTWVKSLYEALHIDESEEK